MSLRPSFIIVTLLLCSLFLMGTCTKLLQARIPADKPNALAGEEGPYLKQASTQRVKWMAYSDRAFREARRLDKPIFLLIGNPWSDYGRFLDRGVFRGREIANYLNRNFVAVRTDTLDHPDWANNYFPGSRAQVGQIAGVQIWILNSEGNPVDFFTREGSSQPVDRGQFLSHLMQASEKVSRAREKKGQESAAAEAQRKELLALRQAPAGSPDLSGFLTKLIAGIDARNGGFPVDRYQVPRPMALRVLLQAQAYADFHSALDPMLKSSLFDVRDGGFFRLAKSRDWQGIQLDKVATENAELLLTLAQASKLCPSPELTYAVSRSKVCISQDFEKEGLIAAYRVGDEGARDRSTASSYPPPRLAQVLEPEEAEWATENLGLDPKRNPQVLPRLATAEALNKERVLAGIVSKLRLKEDSVPIFGGRGYAHVQAITTARLIESAVLLGDKELLASSLSLYEHLRDFKASDDVVHELNSQGSAKYLEDYLGFADASLQTFLATGSVPALNDGLAVLLRAKFLFAGEVPGEYFLASENPEDIGPSNRRAPCVADYGGESPTARIIRLFRAYSLLLVDSEKKSVAAELEKAADATEFLYAAPCAEIGVPCAGFFSSVATSKMPAHAVAVGPDSVMVARKIRSATVFGLAAPALGPVQRSLQEKAAGIYLISSSGSEGPFEFKEAVRRLGLANRP